MAKFEQIKIPHNAKNEATRCSYSFVLIKERGHMNELFVRLLISELRKAKFLEAAYDSRQERVVISTAYSRLSVGYEDGEYIIYYNEESRFLLSVISSIRNNVLAVMSVWEHATPITSEGASRFRKLLEWNGIVLAARDDGARGLHYVTWRSDNRENISNGHYTTDLNTAMQDFVKRSQMIPAEKIFDMGQLAVIHSALSYRHANDDNLSLEAEQKIEYLLSGLDTIMELVRVLKDKTD